MYPMSGNTHIWPILLLLGVASGSYRSIHIANTDVCKASTFSSSKPLEIGEGAIIFRLKNPPLKLQKNVRNRQKLCEIRIKALENRGLTVHVEEMHMRKSRKNGDCVDYLRFGQHDNIPFITMRKSDKLCGERNSKVHLNDGYGYDDPGGNLLIWINLGGRRQTEHWPYIGKVNLTLIVTSYKKKCAKGASSFRSCDKTGNCILKDFFCDRHLNCPTRNYSRIYQAPDELGCVYEEEEPKSTTSPTDNSGGLSFADLNLISWTLIMVCTGIVLLLVIIVVCRARKRRGEKCPYCCSGGSGDTLESSCELPDRQTHSVAELASRRQRRGPREDEQNLYLPLSVLNSPGRRAEQNREDQLIRTNIRNSPLPEEAPPAYHEIFPNGAPPGFDLEADPALQRYSGAPVPEPQNTTT